MFLRAAMIANGSSLVWMPKRTADDVNESSKIRLISSPQTVELVKDYLV